MDSQLLTTAETKPQIKEKSKTFLKVSLLFVIAAGFLVSFVVGFYINSIFKPENPKNNIETSPTPTVQNNDEQIEQVSTKFLPGKFYIDDTVIAITKESIPKTLVATATRVQQEKDYNQTTRVSYFDGSNWLRKISSQTNANSAIVTNNIIKSWLTKIDPTRVLKESSIGTIQMDKTKIIFSTGLLENEISMRSLPGYTKFMSQTDGTITINGQEIPAHILYTHIYSLNAEDIQFYDQTLGITTNWIAFWDVDGNFYHLDRTSVDKPTKIYETHEIGIFENSQGQVSKTFDLKIENDKNIPPTNYQVYLNSPINSVLNITTTNSLDKAPNGSYKWFSGNIKGSVTLQNGQKINGVGLVEYIHN